MSKQTERSSLLHDAAMEEADQADKTMRAGDAHSHGIHLRMAAALEKDAATEHINDLDLQPTRSVLFRSAASLYLQLGEAETAKTLAIEGLRGEASSPIGTELRQMLRSITGDPWPEPEKSFEEETKPAEKRPKKKKS